MAFGSGQVRGMVVPKTGGYVPNVGASGPVLSTMGPMPPSMAALSGSSSSSSGGGSPRKKKKQGPTPGDGGHTPGVVAPITPQKSGAEMAAELAAGYAKPTPVPGASPSIPGASAVTGGAASSGAGGAKVVMPEPDSMSALRGIGSEGGGFEGAGAGANISGPSLFRQGIGRRIMPMDSGALASLRKVY